MYLDQKNTFMKEYPNDWSSEAKRNMNISLKKAK